MTIMPETDLIERLNKRAENGRVFHTDRKLFAEAATALSENIETINGQAMDLATLRARLASCEAALKEAPAQGVVEAAKNAAMYLRTGFIECPHCGEEVETKNTDAEYELNEALAALSLPATDTARPHECPECAGTGYKDKGGARMAVQRTPCSRGCAPPATARPNKDAPFGWTTDVNGNPFPKRSPWDGGDTYLAARPLNSGEAEAALRLIVDFCDDPEGSEKPETLAMGLSRLLPRARAALSSAPSTPEGWRPMDSAPRDGTAIWLLIEGQPMIGYGEKETVLHPDRFIAKFGFRRSDEDFPDDVYGTSYRADPTAWMPLPTPPAGGSE